MIPCCQSFHFIKQLLSLLAAALLLQTLSLRETWKPNFGSVPKILSSAPHGEAVETPSSSPATSHPQTMRTYLYKLTSDRGGAPCAPPPVPGDDPLLTLAICKPAIRRTAQPGDRILGITSHSLAHSDGYPLASVIYAAVVSQNVGSLDYFMPRFTHRPDCIYEFHRLNGEADRAAHSGRTALHADTAHIRKDLGTYPLYRNGHVLFCQDFRYFGPAAVKIPARLHLLNHAAESLGQGHRVYTERDPEAKELDALFRHLWKRPSAFTPTHVASDAYDYAPKSRRPESCQAPQAVENKKSSGRTRKQIC